MAHEAWQVTRIGHCNHLYGDLQNFLDLNFLSCDDYVARAAVFRPLFASFKF